MLRKPCAWDGDDRIGVRVAVRKNKILPLPLNNRPDRCRLIRLAIPALENQRDTVTTLQTCTHTHRTTRRGGGINEN